MKFIDLFEEFLISKGHIKVSAPDFFAREKQSYLKESYLGWSVIKWNYTSHGHSIMHIRDNVVDPVSPYSHGINLEIWQISSPNCIEEIYEKAKEFYIANR